LFLYIIWYYNGIIISWSVTFFFNIEKFLWIHILFGFNVKFAGINIKLDKRLHYSCSLKKVTFIYIINKDILVLIPLIILFNNVPSWFFLYIKHCSLVILFCNTMFSSVCSLCCAPWCACVHIWATYWPEPLASPF